VHIAVGDAARIAHADTFFGSRISYFDLFALLR